MLIFKKGHCQTQAPKSSVHSQIFMGYWHFFCILSLFHPLNIQLQQAYSHTLKTPVNHPMSYLAPVMQQVKLYANLNILFAGHWVTKPEICLLVIL